MQNVSYYSLNWHTFKKYISTWNKCKKGEVQENDGTLLFPPPRTKERERNSRDRENESPWKICYETSLGNIESVTRNLRKSSGVAGHSSKFLTLPGKILRPYVKNACRHDIPIELNHQFGILSKTEWCIAWCSSLQLIKNTCAQLAVLNHNASCLCKSSDNFG